MKVEAADIARRIGMSTDEVAHQISKANLSLLPVRKRLSVLEGETVQSLQVTRLGVGPLLTDHGPMYHYSFRVSDAWKKYSVLYTGAVDDYYMPVLSGKNLIVRIDSGCETGQVFGDRTCDCREQLQITMDVIQMVGQGVIINIPHQDGRGKGLPFKLATLALQQNLHLNTVEAATLLAGGEAIDTRTYSGAIAILKFLGVLTSYHISLASNSPSKMKAFSENGFYVVGFTPVRTRPTKHTEHHLRAKQEFLGHIDLIPNE